ncbi:MAG: hypothetical protein JNM24_08705 [Bdellovibrionaceae bacterium]|nr:hypothetical protein [Pseudobdellovibrionaceae bacterium]
MKYFFVVFIVCITATANAENIYDCSGRYLPYSANAYKKISFVLESTLGENPYIPGIESGTLLSYETDGLRIYAGNTLKRVTAIAEIRSLQNKRIFLRSSVKSDQTETLSIEYNQGDSESDPEVALSLNCLKR